MVNVLPYLSIASARPRLRHLSRQFGHGSCFLERPKLGLVVRNDHGNSQSSNSGLWSRCFYESVSLKDEHGHCFTGDWKDHLQTFEQYQYQSDLGQPASNGPRFLDQPTYNKDFALWLELILFRRRQDDIKSLRALYKEIKLRNLYIPTTGCTADGLWSNFLHVGWTTNRVWKDVVSYARRVQAATGGSWPRLYCQILSHSLRHSPQHAALWHTRLRDNFKPSSSDMKNIFEQAVSSESTLGTFKRMYMDFSIRDMYPTIIPKLCNEGNFKRGIEWHNMLMKMGDIPPDAKVAEPLFHHLALYGKTYQLVFMSKSMTEAGVPVPTSNSKISEGNKIITRELLNRELGDTHKIAPKKLTDEFCGRLFATTAIPVEVSINGLRMLGVDAVGPISVRELAWRELVSRKRSSSEAITRRLDDLKKAGIAVGDSTFCMLVSNLAMQGDERLLEEVVKCDMHPDVFEDRDLQESLLAMYFANGDHLKADRTLAILTAKCKPGNLENTRWNLILRAAVKRGAGKDIFKILDSMQEKMVPVSTKSSMALRRGLLSPREVSKPPTTVAELPSVIAIFQRILQTGGYVHIFQWRELLRRLGMAGLLRDLQKLSIWLAEWYSNPLFRASQSSFFNQKGEQVPNDLPIRHPRHPLRILFPPVVQQAIVTWGFQHTGDFRNPHIRFRNKGLTWRWGIQLLRELKCRNVPIARSTVARACRLRLIALFAKGKSQRLINRRARACTIHQIGYMAPEIERAWGADLFYPFHKFLRGDPRRLEMLQQEILGEKVRFNPTKMYLRRSSGSGPVNTPGPSSNLERRWEALDNKTKDTGWKLQDEEKDENEKVRQIKP